MSERVTGQPSAESGSEMKQRVLRAREKNVEGPFRTLGFTKITYEWTDKGLSYDIDERKREVTTPTGKTSVTQRIQGTIDPSGKGVIVGTIDLAPLDEGKYGGKAYWGLDAIGTGERAIPQDIVEATWKGAVETGRKRWADIAKAKPQDQPTDTLLKADRQNELIYAVLMLARGVLALNIDQNDPLKYVAHEHVSSPDGNQVMLYGGAKYGWKEMGYDGVMAYEIGEVPDEPVLAILGTSNASFVLWLIQDFGRRLGISRLKSVEVRRFGLDVYWQFA